MKLNKITAKGLTIGVIMTNVSINSFSYHKIEDKYEINQIKTKEDLQKSAQKAIKAGEIDTWIEGLANMPTSRQCLTSAVVDGKIYCIGGSNGSSYLNKVEVYDPITDTWETKTPMPTDRGHLTSAVVDGKIYCIGGYRNSSQGRLNTVEVYDPVTDIWETKADMPTARYNLTSGVVDGKIYVIGGYGQVGSNLHLNTVEVYDPITDSWETKADMPTARHRMISGVVDGKIYVIGGYGQVNDTNTFDYLNIVEVYDPVTNTWETKADMPTKRADLTSGVVGNKIYVTGGCNGYGYPKTVEVYDPITNNWESKTDMPAERGSSTSSVINGKIYVIGGYYGVSVLNRVDVYTAKEPSLEEKANSLVINAESTLDVVDIETARDLVNKLSESTLKDELQDRLNAIMPNITSSSSRNTTGNIDVYIKSENMLSMSLDTNSITFDDFSGVEDIEKVNAVNISINSSLPYQLNAYLPVEIQNSDKSVTMNKDILNIKENSEPTYQTFTNTTDKVVLKDNCPAGNDLVHGVDVKLKGGLAFEKDIYKTTIKFEAQQK